MANVPRNTADVPRYTAALGEAYVPGAEIVNRTDSCPKRMLTRPVDDALSQVVRSEALVPAGTVIPTKAGETDQPMADDVCNHTMAGEGVADLVIAGESNAATASGQKRVNLRNDSIGINREVRGDDLAQESPTAALRERSVKWRAAIGGDLKSLGEVNGYSRGRSRL
nr:unnamed protein product [Callosobruchus analis]